MANLLSLYNPCRLCPRNCGVNRLAGETGFCGESAKLRVAYAGLHRGEEPPLTGTGGSGTIFVSGCNLGCVFCQNYQISHSADNVKSLGREFSAEDFAAVCAALRDKGAENINIVTGSHAVPAIIEGIDAARKAGVLLPVLWNSSAYENVKTLELLGEYVDAWLPDLKTTDSGTAGRFFNAPDYPSAAKDAILKMIEISKMESGDSCSLSERIDNTLLGNTISSPLPKVIIRHLILPDCLESTRSVLRWFAANVKDRAQLSLMTQYTPVPGKTNSAPKRHLSKEEYETVIHWLKELEIEDGFCQELVTGNDWLPDFSRRNPFLSELSVPVQIN